MSVENPNTTKPRSLKKPLILGSAALVLALGITSTIGAVHLKSEINDSVSNVAQTNVAGFNDIEKVEDAKHRSIVRALPHFMDPKDYKVTVGLQNGGICNIYTETTGKGLNGISFLPTAVKLIDEGTCPRD